MAQLGAVRQPVCESGHCVPLDGEEADLAPQARREEHIKVVARSKRIVVFPG